MQKKTGKPIRENNEEKQRQENGKTTIKLITIPKRKTANDVGNNKYLRMFFLAEEKS